MRSRHQTDHIRGTRNGHNLGALADWSFDTESGSWYETSVGATTPAQILPIDTGSGESWFEATVNAAKSIIPAYYAAKTQEDISQINLERMRRGQAPLPESYLRAAAPQVRAGLSPDTQRMVMILGVGLLAVLALPMLLRRR